MNLDLQDKVVVVTGGTSGIGLAAARIFLAEGAMVAICGRDETRLAAAKASLNASSNRLLAMPCNVLDKEALRRRDRAVDGTLRHSRQQCRPGADVDLCRHHG
jgi:NAD(P)-dependent dehydrogenase (short-subunit alcohol dehydrogenase family)